MQTAKWLKKEGLGKFMGGHCTGINAATKISSIVGLEAEDLSHTAVGSILTKDLKIIRSSVE
jgi:metal-dependent hydrolase (beta-lactamase superfamily II)